MKPCSSDSRAPSVTGTAAESITAPTPEARQSLNRWPSRPNPVTSVAARTPAATAAWAASRLSSTICATACGKTSPVRLWRLFRTPTPIGLVSVSGSPGWAASLRISFAGSATPVTAMPYLGSGSSMEWPPVTGHRASAATSRPPRSTSVSISMGSFSRGQPTRLMAVIGVPPIA